MSIDDPFKIDGIVSDKEANTIILVITDHLNWSEDDQENLKHLLKIQEKINTYIAYVESDQIIESCDYLENCKININIYFKYAILVKYSNFFEKLSEALSEINITLKLIPPAK